MMDGLMMYVHKLGYPFEKVRPYSHHKAIVSWFILGFCMDLSLKEVTGKGTSCWNHAEIYGSCSLLLFFKHRFGHPRNFNIQILGIWQILKEWQVFPPWKQKPGSVTTCTFWGDGFYNRQAYQKKINEQLNSNFGVRLAAWEGYWDTRETGVLILPVRPRNG